MLYVLFGIVESHKKHMIMQILHRIPTKFFVIAAAALLALGAILFTAAPAPSTPSITQTPTSPAASTASTSTASSNDTTVVDFETAAPGILTGVFAGINWAGNWIVDELTCGGCQPKLIYMANTMGEPTCRTFTFEQPAVLESFKASVHTKPQGALTVTTYDANEQSLETYATTPVHEACGTFTTGFSKPATTVKVCFDHGWELALDDIGYVTWQRVAEAISGVSFAIPPELEAAQGEDLIDVFNPSQQTLPPLLEVYVIDYSTPFSTSSSEETLLNIAKKQLGFDLVRIVGFHDNGIEVEATTIFSRHFFMYDPAANRAIEFRQGRHGFFDSQDFRSILQSVAF